MKKKRIIISLVITFVLLAIIVLPCFVFRIREIDVTFLNAEPRSEKTSDISNQDIIDASKIKYGSFTLMLDRGKAIKNIEQAQPFVNVVQISTTSPMDIQIIVKERHQTYFTKHFDGMVNKYYVMDEELKILYILDNQPEDITEIAPNTLKIDNKTEKFDVLGTASQQSIFTNLYKQAYKNITINNQYLSRAEIMKLITQVKLDTGNTMNREYVRVIMQTSYGINIDIGDPTRDFGYKINACFAVLNDKVSQDITAGTIKYFYDSNGQAKLGFFD